MSTYTAPTDDMMFVLNNLAGLPKLTQLPGLEDATPDIIEAVLGEASKLASEVHKQIYSPTQNHQF